MSDLQTIKSQLMGLSYNDKIQMSEWLHTQIDFERGEAVKAKGAEVSSKIESFLDKAIKVTTKAGDSLMDQFKTATTNTPENNKQIEGEKK